MHKWIDIVNDRSMDQWIYIPRLTVTTSDLICCIVSQIARPEITDPPGQFMYRQIGWLGFSLSKYWHNIQNRSYNVDDDDDDSDDGNDRDGYDDDDGSDDRSDDDDNDDSITRTRTYKYQ